MKKSGKATYLYTYESGKNNGPISSTPTDSNSGNCFFVVVVVLSAGSSGKDVRLVMNVFAETAFFRPGRLETGGVNATGGAILNSKVISAKVTVDGNPVSDLDTDVVTTVYLPIVVSTVERKILF